MPSIIQYVSSLHTPCRSDQGLHCCPTGTQLEHGCVTFIALPGAAHSLAHPTHSLV